MALIAYPAANANSYVSNAAADIYFSNRLNSAKWTDADEATQDQALVTSTSIIEREKFRGARTSDTQDLEFPRTGLTDRYNTPVDDASIPNEVKLSTYELAIEILSNGAIQTKGNVASNKKRLITGEVEIEYFGNNDPRGSATLPSVVYQYLKYFIDNSYQVGCVVYGTDEKSQITSYNRQEPLM
jgi:hypothetical protein